VVLLLVFFGDFDRCEKFDANLEALEDLNPNSLLNLLLAIEKSSLFSSSFFSGIFMFFWSIYLNCREFDSYTYISVGFYSGYLILVSKLKSQSLNGSY